MTAALMRLIPSKTLTTSRVREVGFRLGLRAAVLAERLLFGDVWVEVNQRWHQDVGGIHDLVAHDDLSEGHAVELLLRVRLHRLDLSLTCVSTTVTVKNASNIWTNTEEGDLLLIVVLMWMQCVCCYICVYLWIWCFWREGFKCSHKTRSPLMSFSTQVKVIPPSLLLSLKRSRNVPGGFGLRMARSLSLLIKPIIYLTHIHESLM